MSLYHAIVDGQMLISTGRSWDKPNPDWPYYAGRSKCTFDRVADDQEEWQSQEEWKSQDSGVEQDHTDVLDKSTSEGDVLESDDSGSERDSPRPSSKPRMIRIKVYLARTIIHALVAVTSMISHNYWSLGLLGIGGSLSYLMLGYGIVMACFKIWTAFVSSPPASSSSIFYVTYLVCCQYRPPLPTSDMFPPIVILSFSNTNFQLRT